MDDLKPDRKAKKKINHNLTLNLPDKVDYQIQKIELKLGQFGHINVTNQCEKHDHKGL